MTKTIALTLLVLLPLSAAAAQNEPEILVDLASMEGRAVEQVYEGHPLLYVVTLNRVRAPFPPELAGFDDFHVQLLHEQSIGYARFASGAAVRELRNAVRYQYQLTPLKTGLLRIPGPTAKVDGRVLRGPERTLRVIPAPEQDVVFMQITSDRQSAYLTRPFTVTLTLAVRALDPPFADRDPVSIQRELRRRPPALRIPWITDSARLPDGLEPEADLDGWARPFLNRRGAGFSINGMTTGGSPFPSFPSLFDGPFESIFDRRETATFLPKARRVTRRDASGEQAEYWQYEFSRTFVPRRAGRYGFGPVALDGEFVADVNDRGVADLEQVHAVAQRIEVIIKDAPEQGRPDTYIGAVGRFELDAELTPQKAKVGDPMTLTLTLTGEGTLETTSAPDLARLPEIAGRFKIYDATEESKDSASRFTYSLRPLEQGIEAFPPVPVSYFDAESERYVTLRTEPIPIEVTKAERLSDDQIVAGPGGSSRKRSDLEVRREGIFANVPDVSAVRDESVRPGRWLLGLGGMAGLYAVVALVTIQLRGRFSDTALLRRRAAPGMARGRLRQAVAELEAGRIRQGADLVEDALVGLVADVADLPEAGLTPKDVWGQLRAFGVDDELVDRVGSLLETCDAARYGSINRTDGLGRQAHQVLEEVIQSLKSRKRFR